MDVSLPPDEVQQLTLALEKANRQFALKYPGESGRRQPVHTVYGGAHLFKADSAARLGSLARRSLDQFAPDFIVFAKALDLPGANRLDESLDQDEQLLARLETDSERVRQENKGAWLAHTIYNRVAEKLRREPVEDFRIDFEDGYGNRPDEEEDGHAVAAAQQVAAASIAGTLPPFIGIRIKPLTRDLAARSLRTLDIFLTELVTATNGHVPPGFVVTLPKIQSLTDVETIVD